jgi:hypothetical protein
MNESFWDKVADARNLGSAAFVCLAIVVWIGARACYAFFQEAIFYSLRESLLWWIQQRQLRIQSQTNNLSQVKTNKANHIALAPVTGSRIWGKSDRDAGQSVFIVAGWSLRPLDEMIPDFPEPLNTEKLATRQFRQNTYGHHFYHIKRWRS